jgi:predicted pyridoxine 5'-phosphate oxidase superfamily flavin-nucleotide-binding protein
MSRLSTPLPETAPNTDIVFSPAVKERQARHGSRDMIERWERRGGFREDRDHELHAFIAQRDSFYLGTAGADGQPYIQHRGGPRGFLRVLGDRKLAFAEFAGNKQYVSYGNLDENPKATLFLMDYANRARIKVWGRAEVVEDDPELLAAVDDPDYPSRPERAIVFHVDAWDGNCPQHIPVLLPADAVEEALTTLRDRVAELERENESLRTLAADAGPVV